jgi:hypothetical protein
VANDDDGSAGLTVVKGVLLTLGALMAGALLLKIAFPLAMLGLAAAAGYFGFKVLSKTKALEGGKDRKQLMSSADFDRKMRELDAQTYENLLRPAFKDDEWIIVVLGAALGFLFGELQAELIVLLASH